MYTTIRHELRHAKKAWPDTHAFSVLRTFWAWPPPPPPPPITLPPHDQTVSITLLPLLRQQKDCIGYIVNITGTESNVSVTSLLLLRLQLPWKATKEAAAKGTAVIEGAATAAEAI